MLLTILNAKSVEEATAFVFSDAGPIKAQGFEVRPAQRALAIAAAKRIDVRQGWTLGEAPCGCHAKGQGVLMFDGDVKLVEDITIGDRLMGPDSQPRTVLALARGRECMVDVVPTKGVTFRVNRSHILTLVRQGRPDPKKRKDRRNGEIIDVMVSNVMDRWTRSQRALYRLVRSGVREFGGERVPLDIPPWVLGAMLGDGGFGLKNASTTFTSIDPEVYEEVRNYVLSIGCQWKSKGDDRHYLITNIPTIRRNPLRTKLRTLGLFPTKCHDKFVPMIYKTASWDDRLELLAGLIDTDGASNGYGGFDYISKSERLSRDVAFVARSLGFAAYVTACEKWSQLGTGGTYWRVSISGDCSIVPIRLLRKRAAARIINKDPLRTGFILVEREEEDFYGFSLDGDGRFLLDDFTVTHNTGKGMAYLIPGIIGAIRAEAAWANGVRPEGEPGFRKLIVSTANIALQGQLIGKDIPAVAKLLGVEVKASLWKGRSNYLCLERVEEAAMTLGFNDRPMTQLIRWAGEDGCTGDKEDLTWDPGTAWSRLSVGSEECHGKKCPHFRPNPDEKADLCFAERSRFGMMQAHVVIVNHHLLAVQRPIPSVLLAVDEAHELETALRSAASGQLTERGTQTLVSKVEKILGPEEARRMNGVEDLFLTLGVYLEAQNTRYSQVLPMGWHKNTFRTHSLTGLLQVVELLGKAAKQANDENAAGKIEILAERIENLYVRAHTLADGQAHASIGDGDSPWAIWADIKQSENERTGRKEKKITGQMAPADVSKQVMALQRAYPACLLTSATMVVERKFDYIRDCLGLGKLGAPPAYGEVEIKGTDGGTRTEHRQTAAAGPVEELILPSPFPLAQMGVLIIPGDAPSPKEVAWEAWAIRKVVEIVRLAKGRTLVLASSWKMMEAYGAALACADDQPYPVRVQGQAGRNELIKWFKEEMHGVLVGTKSFYTGLDVQGEALSCLLIDRVPFDPPGDPLEEAVGQMMTVRLKRPGQAFYLRSLPKTCMVLAQGAGRLIRSQTDRGVIVCLDNKVVSGGMAETIRASFPPFPISRDIRDVANLLEGLPLQGVISRPSAAPQSGGGATTTTMQRITRRGHHVPSA